MLMVRSVLLLASVQDLLSTVAFPLAGVQSDSMVGLEQDLLSFDSAAVPPFIVSDTVESTNVEKYNSVPPGGSTGSLLSFDNCQEIKKWRKNKLEC